LRLGGVLRARQAQEDVARAAAQRARANAEATAAQIRRWEHALDLRGVPEHSSAAAHAATLSARQALASALCAAIGVARLAEENAQVRAGELTQAATARLSVERFTERQAAEQRRADEAAEGRQLDEIAARTKPPAHRSGGEEDR
jgi:flagellar biosynthesis chaperone FliJ